MKRKLFAIFLVALTVGAVAQAEPPIVVAPLVPSTVGPQKDGPYRLLVAARADAAHRRSQGYHAEPVHENGHWWVVYGQ